MKQRKKEKNMNSPIPTQSLLIEFLLVGCIQYVSLYFRQDDALIFDGLLHTRLVGREQLGARISAQSFQKSIPKPIVETRIVFFLQFLAVFTNTVHSSTRRQRLWTKI